jgi:hypothetical protein
MLTIFSTPKPFRGHSGIIQRNAIESWTLLHQDCEVILFGDEEGAGETSRELGIHHEPAVQRTETGTKYLGSLFERAQRIAQHDILCYANCDILLMSDFRRAVEQVASLGQPFLMIGARWDVDILEPWNFEQPDWEQRMRALVFERGKRRGTWLMDYFVFSRGLYVEIPSLVIGRNFWDNWLIWKARSLGVPVVNATPVVTAVHQNHDYGYHPRGASGIEQDEQTLRNYELAGNGQRAYTRDYATHRLTHSGIKRNWLLPLAPAKIKLLPIWYRCWFAALNVTRPVRHAFGLHNKTFEKLLMRTKRGILRWRERQPTRT